MPTRMVVITHLNDYYYSLTDFIENDIIVDDDDDERENTDDSETPADSLSSSMHTGTL